jgi:hypothetical protein
VEPEPPPITITDPNAPALTTADLLDTGPDRWQPSPYQKALALLTAAIVALISGGVAAVRHIDHERALDRASVRAVTVYASIDVAPVDPSHEMAEPGLVLSVANLGRDTVQLVRVRLDGTALTLPDAGLVLAAGATFTEPLPPATCTGTAGRTRTREVTVDVRTPRGQEVGRRILLEGAQLTVSNFRDRAACWTQLPEEAFGVGLSSVTRRGRVVTARLLLSNYSLLDVTVRGVRGLPGLRPVVRGLPLLVPARADPHHITQDVGLVVVLRAVDCHAFARYLEGAGDEPALPVDLHGALEDGEGRIPLLLSGEGGAGLDLLSSIAGACPNLYTDGPQD